MRLEDKELEGPDLEREQGLEQLEDGTHEHDKDLPVYAGPEVVDAELSQRTRMFDALRTILSGENLSIPMLYLPQREAQALEALQSAVTGRDRSMNTFMFAEDRKSLLEQALSVLQQNLTRGDAQTLSALSAKYDILTETVANLREELLGLEDAQDDLIEQKQRKDVVASGAETEDAAPSSEPGFLTSALEAIKASTLVGPELPEPAKAPSTLDGPEVKPAHRPSALSGQDLPTPTLDVSMLDAPGPEVTRQDHISALGGPEVEQEAKPSSLFTEGVGERLVPPRLAAHQPVGMRTDDHVDREFAPHVDDGRGPAPPTTAGRQRQPSQPVIEPPSGKPEEPTKPGRRKRP